MSGINSIVDKLNKGQDAVLEEELIKTKKEVNEPKKSTVKRGKSILLDIKIFEIEQSSKDYGGQLNCKILDRHAENFRYLKMSGNTQIALVNYLLEDFFNIIV